MDVYGVTHADVSAELPGLFPGGFSPSSKPTDAQVESWISTADAVVTMKVQDVTGSTPASTDKAAVVARQYIVEWVTAKVMRAVYAGNDPAAVRAAAEPHEASARDLIKSLEMLGLQATGTGDAAPRVAVSYQTPERDLLITTEQLDNDEGFRERRY